MPITLFLRFHLNESNITILINHCHFCEGNFRVQDVSSLTVPIEHHVAMGALPAVNELSDSGSETAEKAETPVAKKPANKDGGQLKRKASRADPEKPDMEKKSPRKPKNAKGKAKAKSKAKGKSKAKAKVAPQSTAVLTSEDENKEAEADSGAKIHPDQNCWKLCF